MGRGWLFVRLRPQHERSHQQHGRCSSVAQPPAHPHVRSFSRSCCLHCRHDFKCLRTVVTTSHPPANSSVAVVGGDVGFVSGRGSSLNNTFTILSNVVASRLLVTNASVIAFGDHLSNDSENHQVQTPCSFGARICTGISYWPHQLSRPHRPALFSQPLNTFSRPLAVVSGHPAFSTLPSSFLVLLGRFLHLALLLASLVLATLTQNLLKALSALAALLERLPLPVHRLLTIANVILLLHSKHVTFQRPPPLGFGGLTRIQLLLSPLFHDR
jgi:hypothetical protein